jgi:uncharacterized protein YozE (UPF0346 family)
MTDMLHDIIHSYCIKKQILKTKRNLKSQFQFEVISQESFQPQSFPLHSFDVEILSYHPLERVYGIPYDFDTQTFLWSRFF